MHKAGFVNIIGSPNVGKSTLMNTLIGEKLCIITQKAQTTRHRIIGILNNENYQIVFSDTPGILTPHYKLHEAMMKQVMEAIEDADILLFMTEPEEKINEKHLPLYKQINDSEIPVFLLINKTDISEAAKIESCKSQWQEIFPKARIFQISALLNLGVADVLNAIIETLPESPPFYSKEELTDRPVRFFVSEIIREKILLLYSQEIPYSVEIVIDSFKEEEHITKISATIFVARESQKAIILGHKGNAIKRLGIAARKDIENFLDKHVFLELTVKVRENWRDDEKILKRFGYET